MKKTKLHILSFGLLVSFAVNISAQSVTNTIDNDRQRGFYDQPYKRYEAETGKCSTTGDILPASFAPSALQSEASNQQAISLTAQNSYIEWVNDEAADGLVIRFSIPDNAEGTGTIGNIALYVDDVYVQDIELNSYWAWQYFSGYENVAYNFPGSYSIKRMRFDEARVKLASKIPTGKSFKLVKIDDNTNPYTIDFVELEPVPNPIDYDTISGDKVQYLGDGSDLQAFMNTNGGKIIYIPSGTYNISQRLYLSANTKLQGAGMWYTELYFTAALTSSTYSQRGIESSYSNISIDGLYLNTVNNIRYYNRNEAYQVGKALNGSFGTGSSITNVWEQHFECGGWINSTSTLTVANCRFRDNYADGLNLSGTSKNSIVEHCSFRNNGDDDMASWSSSSSQPAFNNTFRYCTSEHNWRASGIGFFGGKQNKAYNCVVSDPLECGLRVDATFGGSAFSTDGFTEFNNISVYRAGTSKNVWNSKYGAINITTTGAQYNLSNISFKNIDVIDSKQDGIYAYGSGNYTIGVCMENININGTKTEGSGTGYGLNISTSTIKGKLFYNNILFENIIDQDMVNYANVANFTLSELTVEPCNELISVGIEPVRYKSINVTYDNGILRISTLPIGDDLSIYNIIGHKVYDTTITNETEEISSLKSGTYIISIKNIAITKKIVITEN